MSFLKINGKKSLFGLLAGFGVLVLGSQMSFASEVSFEKGNDYLVHTLTGVATVDCRDGNQWDHQIVTCRGRQSDPSSQSHLIGPRDSRIKRVVLTARANGETRSKKVDYDGAAGRSEDAVNLLISSVLQKPLLQLGVNRIEYALQNAQNQTLSTGFFEVEVSAGESKRCPHDYFTSFNINDCRGTSICSYYFQRNAAQCKPANKF